MMMMLLFRFSGIGPTVGKKEEKSEGGRKRTAL
jgi:hypothetical protein